MEDYQKEYKKQAEKFCKEVQKLGFVCKVEKGESLTDYRVIATYSNHQFLVNKDYYGYISVSMYPYPRHEGVGHGVCGELREKIKTSQNMKVMTEKKLTAKLDEEILMYREMNERQKDHEETIAEFLAEVDKLKPDYRRDYSFDENNERVDKDIIGGEITKNGISYSFKLEQNGYIQQEIKIDYSVDNSIHSFNNLSNNKYKKCLTCDDTGYVGEEEKCLNCN